ncbi:hypothetical protein [Palleronia rufa]|uniref:hypothetical protein n=2 Tax=Palleronia rufa TaxID=1530186 RepID=UPI001F405BF6|nr:hypothetical protein [Palleronia rufa]
MKDATAMPRFLTPILVALVLVLGAAAADAACLVEYKAKRDAPLRLHYGIIELADAECANPGPAVAGRIAADGWELLTVMGKLTPQQAEQRRSDAGPFYLRY